MAETLDIEGCVDRRTIHHVAGWARNRSNPGERVTVEAVLPAPGGERILGVAAADAYHGALSRRSGDDVWHGFQIYFDPPVAEAERELIFVRAQAARAVLDLALPPPKPLPVPVPEAAPAPPPIHGFIDDLSRSHVAGWIVDLRTPDQPVGFEVVVGEARLIAQGLADQVYPPLQDSGFGDARHGFHLAFLDPLTLEERNSLVVRPAGAAIFLPRAPGFQGFVDERSTHHVAGWVRDRFRPEEFLAFEVLLIDAEGERRIGSGVADIFHEGLAQGAPEDAGHGFRLVFRRPLTIEQRDKLIVRLAGAPFILPESPNMSDAPYAEKVAEIEDWTLPFQKFAAEGYEFAVDAVTKFYNTLRIFGWFHHPEDRLTGVRLVGEAQLGSLVAVGLDHDGVRATHGPGKGFSIQILKPDEPFNEEAELEFTTASGWTGRANLKLLCKARLQPRFHKTSLMLHDFLDRLDVPGARILDIGGRSRSLNDFSLLFKQAECVVFDILAGDNVDVVGDAHEMAKIFAPASFDAIYSVSTFEHLLMPWAVAVQMNAILKPGGLALIFSHQTLGVHDAPWDFWRFSDTAWDALFNARTGFEIIDRAMSFEQHVLPFIWRPNKTNEERVVGFEGSAVLVRKIGGCEMSWPLTPGDLTASTYPAGVMRSSDQWA
jgi:hypothetical protein